MSNKLIIKGLIDFHIVARFLKMYKIILWFDYFSCPTH